MGNMVASVNLATAKKMVARPPMVALLATSKYGCAKTKYVEYIQHSFSFASREHDVARFIMPHGCVNSISDYHNTVPPTLNIVARGIPLTIFNIDFI
jgi:hypothetical protein